MEDRQTYNFPGSYEYYAAHNDRFIAKVVVDHEMGFHDAAWDVDYAADKPLFTIRLESERDTPSTLHIGYRSKGVKDPRKDGALVFPFTTGRYMFFGERLAFVEPSKLSPKRSLTTGEKVEVVTERQGDTVIMRSATDGVVEEILLPESVDFGILWSVSNATATISDPSRPYQQWLQLLSTDFQTKQ